MASIIFQEVVNMDLIKTGLIIAIGVTFYYLLLQWPTESNTREIAAKNHHYNSNINDSESSLQSLLLPSQILMLVKRNMKTLKAVISILNIKIWL